MVRETNYKPKIGRAQSFAIGVRDLAKALDGVPQDDLMQLCFGKAASAPNDKLVVLSAGYHCIPEHGIGPGWVIWARAVPRSIKGHVKATLIGDAIPRLLKPWLVARADLFGRPGEDVLDLVFSPPTGTIEALPGHTRRRLEPHVVRRRRT